VQNLRLLLQVAGGVDAETWLHHLRRGDYSRWVRDAIKDEEVAGDIATVERSASVTTGPAAAADQAAPRSGPPSRRATRPGEPALQGTTATCLALRVIGAAIGG
jgi:hypothetical protein